MIKKYQTIGVSGTFDHLHKGHEKILQTALANGQKIYCGIMADQIIWEKILPQTIQNFAVREKAVKDFLSKNQALDRVEFIKLFDCYGPTLGKTQIQAIVASQEKEKIIDEINKKRLVKKLLPLGKIIVPMYLAEDKKIISSSRIRLGEIDRQGLVYKNIFNKNLELPLSLRSFLKKPLGQLKQKNKLKILKAPFIGLVGDIVTDFFIKTCWPFSLAIIDYKTKRQLLPENYHQKLITDFNNFGKINNQPGTINSEVFPVLEKIIKLNILKNKVWFWEITGEEDLLVLPLILLSPLQSLIYYGQPDQGVVVIRVTEELKNKVLRILQKFN